MKKNPREGVEGGDDDVRSDAGALAPGCKHLWMCRRAEQERLPQA